MSKTIVSLAAFREDMLRLGYHVRVTRYADFGKARVCHSRGPINNGNVVTPEHLAEHAGFYDTPRATPCAKAVTSSSFRSRSCRIATSPHALPSP